jgi:hypothetical protein
VTALPEARTAASTCSSAIKVRLPSIVGKEAPMVRTILIGVGTAALAGCAARAPEPEIITYTGSRDPAYAIPQKYRDAQLQARADRFAAAQFQQEVGRVHEAVQRDPNFGGFILRWSPEPHAVVMFTGDAEARLRRYTRDPRYKAQRVELTLAQLEAMKDAFGGQLSRLGLRCFTVDGDEEYNTVTVGAPPEELAKVRSAIAAGRVKAPRKLRLKEEGCAEFR